jgi:hypothetical protein
MFMQGNGNLSFSVNESLQPVLELPESCSFVVKRMFWLRYERCFDGAHTLGENVLVTLRSCLHEPYKLISDTSLREGTVYRGKGNLRQRGQGA